MFAFFEVGEDEVLPVAVEGVFGACGGVLYAAAGWEWFEEYVCFCVVAEWFEVSGSFDGLCDGFFVEDCAGAECYVESEAVVHHLLDDFELYCAHELEVYFLESWVPCDV